MAFLTHCGDNNQFASLRIIRMGGSVSNMEYGVPGKTIVQCNSVGIYSKVQLCLYQKPICCYCYSDFYFHLPLPLHSFFSFLALFFPINPFIVTGYLFLSNHEPG